MFLTTKGLEEIELIDKIGNVMESDGCVTVASMFDISYGTAFTILTEY